MREQLIRLHKDHINVHTIVWYPEEPQSILYFQETSSLNSTHRPTEVIQSPDLCPKRGTFAQRFRISLLEIICAHR